MHCSNSLLIYFRFKSRVFPRLIWAFFLYSFCPYGPVWRKLEPPDFRNKITVCKCLMIGIYHSLCLLASTSKLRKHDLSRESNYFHCLSSVMRWLTPALHYLELHYSKRHHCMRVCMLFFAFLLYHLTIVSKTCSSCWFIVVISNDDLTANDLYTNPM